MVKINRDESIFILRDLVRKWSTHLVIQVNLYAL